MPRALMEKMKNIHKQMGNVSREIKTLKKKKEIKRKFYNPQTL